MGENAQFNGATIKIGTAENMYYLRPDQIDQVTGYTFNDDVMTSCRFRFPFPNEDRNEPGDFDNPDRGLGVYGFEPPEGVEHSTIQFKASAGVLVSLPCPYSIEGRKYAESGLVRYMFNGYAGPVKLTQTRKWAGVWVPVLDCGACGAKFRLPDLESAEPFLTVLGVKASNEDNFNGWQDTTRGDYWCEIIRRIRMGFAGKIPGPVKVAK